MEKILLVGASSTIMKELAYLFAKDKFELILAGRNLEELKKSKADVEIRYNISVDTIYFNALDADVYPVFFEQCVNQFGSIHGVVVAHGFLGDQKKAESSFDETKRIMEINFLSYVGIINGAANYFEKKGSGFICAVSSVAGDRGRQSNYLYGTTKGALSVYLQGVRNRLEKKGIQVLTVKPGFVDTKMTYGLLKNSSLLVSSPQKAAAIIYRSIKKKHDIVYTPYWRYIMLIIKIIPEKIFKKLNL